jgi:hypothetical protein
MAMVERAQTRRVLARREKATVLKVKESGHEGTSN